jgi:hypothetical protein
MSGMKFRDAAQPDEWSGEIEVSALPYGIGMFMGLSKRGQTVASAHVLMPHGQAERLIRYLQRALLTSPASAGARPVIPPPGGDETDLLQRTAP